MARGRVGTNFELGFSLWLNRLKFKVIILVLFYLFSLLSWPIFGYLYCTAILAKFAVRCLDCLQQIVSNPQQQTTILFFKYLILFDKFSYFIFLTDLFYPLVLGWRMIVSLIIVENIFDFSMCTILLNTGKARQQ